MSLGAARLLRIGVADTVHTRIGPLRYDSRSSVMVENENRASVQID